MTDHSPPRNQKPRREPPNSKKAHLNAKYNGAPEIRLTKGDPVVRAIDFNSVTIPHPGPPRQTTQANIANIRALGLQ
jgi:hypothetical protein